MPERSLAGPPMEPGREAIWPIVVPLIAAPCGAGLTLIGTGTRCIALPTFPAGVPMPVSLLPACVVTPAVSCPDRRSPGIATPIALRGAAASIPGRIGGAMRALAGGELAALGAFGVNVF